jgi:hypothetical protein
MDILTAVIACLLAGALLTAVVLWLLLRTAGFAGGGERRGRAEAAEFLRRHEDDRRLPRRLRTLADDARTPAKARTRLRRVARYLDDPITLAPPEIPLLGRFDEIAIGSSLLVMAWRAMPAELWDECFPDAAQTRRALAAGETGAKPVTLSDALRADMATGRQEQLLRRLDRALPDWPVASTLAEVAREILELDRSVALARGTGVPDAVTTRLTAEARAAEDALWNRADRLVAAAGMGVETASLQEALEREDAQLLRLRASIRESRAALAELTLTGAAGDEAYRRAESRFRSLAETARALQEWEREALP